jgi:endonuclease-3 related protein
MYDKLYRRFGPQHWWPAGTPFEVMLGAILTQNTSWSNVEKAILNLKRSHVLDPDRLFRMRQSGLASLIRPAGYYNIKAARLKNFLRFFFSSCDGSVRSMARKPTHILRAQLLAVNGIGPETADSILLYALKKPVFVVDAYTRRILCRHKLIRETASYEDIQQVFMRALRSDVQLFNEYHALLVRLGKEYCLKNRPRCEQCPLTTR